MGCPRRPNDHGLVPIQDKAGAVFLGGRLKIGQIIATARFCVGECKDVLARHDAAKVFFLLRIRAALEETTTANNARHVRLDHEALAELFHDDHRINRAATKAAIFFAERCHQETKLSKLCPHFRTPARFGRDDLAARVEIILLADQPREAVADHVLLFGEIEVHLLSSLPRAP